MPTVDGFMTTSHGESRATSTSSSTSSRPSSIVAFRSPSRWERSSKLIRASSSSRAMERSDQAAASLRKLGGSLPGTACGRRNRGLAWRRSSDGVQRGSGRTQRSFSRPIARPATCRLPRSSSATAFGATPAIRGNSLVGRTRRSFRSITRTPCGVTTSPALDGGAGWRPRNGAASTFTPGSSSCIATTFGRGSTAKPRPRRKGSGSSAGP